MYHHDCAGVICFYEINMNIRNALAPVSNFTSIHKTLYNTNQQDINRLLW